MRIDPAGWPFIGISLLLGFVTWLWGGWAYASVFLVFAGFFLFFFRDPHRTVTADADTVVSPADGRVMVAGAPTGQGFPPGQWQQISIFLSPMDVHINRMPIGGRVTKVEYHPGRFLPAFKVEAGDLNEYTEVWLDHEGQTIVVRQIVGILARRIVCRTHVGADVKAGDRYGVMKFGSRMDLFLPLDAVVRVKVGDRTVAAETVLAELKRQG